MNPLERYSQLSNMDSIVIDAALELSKTTGTIELPDNIGREQEYKAAHDYVMSILS